MFEIPLEPCAPRFERVPSLIVDEAGVAAARRQAQIRVVDPEQQPMLRARREHAIRLEASLRDQVVDENADVRLVAPQLERRLARRARRAALMPATRPCAAASS